MPDMLMGDDDILDTARAVIARHDASPNSMHMSFCDAAPALAREVIRLHAAVTDEDREAATIFRREADACTSRARIYEKSAKTRQGAAFQRADLQLALGQHELAGAYRSFAEALLRPDETAALRKLLAEAREAVVTCLDVWPDGAVGQKCADLLARIDAATKVGA